MSLLKRCPLPVPHKLPLLPKFILQQHKAHKLGIKTHLPNQGKKKKGKWENVCRVTQSQIESTENYGNRIHALKQLFAMQKFGDKDIEFSGGSAGPYCYQNWFGVPADMGDGRRGCQSTWYDSLLDNMGKWGRQKVEAFLLRESTSFCSPLPI